MSERILVVEDDVDGQAVVKGVLDYFNFGADIVDDAETALQALDQSAYAAVIIDLMLPGMDGVELVQHIREAQAFANLPCIAITAYHTSAVKQNALEHGFDAYFPKPIDNQALIQQIEMLLA